MVSYKLDKYDKYFVAFVLVVLVIFNISQCFAVETEDVDYTTVTGMAFDQNTNHFVTGVSNRNTGYFQLESGYVYYISLANGYSGIFLATSESLPASNVPLNYIGTLSAGQTYSYLANNQTYLYFSFSNSSGVSVTREKVEGQQSAINDLVENVGVDQLWSTFESGIDFIGVVVLVAFGIFLIVLLIKKISKGKSDF